MDNKPSNKTLTRSAFWASSAFYGLNSLEFFYMFSPFAAYFYGVYGPGLDLLAASERTSWLIAFFMPHIANPDVTTRLASISSPGHRYIWYVMPSDLYISEVPMYIPDGAVPSHESPGSKDQSRYKIIITKAEFGAGEPADGLEILRRAIHKIPFLEVWIDRDTKSVEGILEPPSADIYFGMPVPIF